MGQPRALSEQKEREILNDYIHSPESIAAICRKHRCGWAQPFRIYKKYFTKKDPITGKEYLDTTQMRKGGKQRNRDGKPNFGKRRGVLKKGD